MDVFFWREAELGSAIIQLMLAFLYSCLFRTALQQVTVSSAMNGFNVYLICLSWSGPLLSCWEKAVGAVDLVFSEWSSVL